LHRKKTAVQTWQECLLFISWMRILNLTRSNITAAEKPQTTRQHAAVISNG